MMVTMTDTREELVRASRTFKRRRDAFEQSRDELAAAIVAADRDGVAQKEIVAVSGYTREAVRQLCMTPEQRETEKEKRRRRTRVKPADTQ